MLRIFPAKGGAKEGFLQLTHQKKLIDILADQGKVSPDFVSANHNLSNLELENKLKLDHLASAEDIARAYAKLFDLPFVSLKDQEISKDVLSLVPEEVVRRFKVIAYGRQGSPGIRRILDNGGKEVVHIGIAEPSKLAMNRQEILDELERKRGLKLDLAIITLDDFWAAVNSSQKKDLPVAKTVSDSGAQVKTVELDKMTIPREIITKFPEDIARRYQMVVFDSPHPSLIRVALVNPDDEKVRKILNFIKSKNDVAVDEYKVAPEQLEHALKFYKQPEQKPQPKPMPEPPNLAAEPIPKIPAEPPAIPPKQEIKEPPPEKLTEEEKEMIKPQIKPEQIPEVVGPQIRKSQPLVMASEKDLDKFVGQNVRDVRDIEEIAQTGHVPKTLAALVILAVSKKASDIHIEPTEKYLRVRFRIDGLLKDVIKLPTSTHPAMISRVKILSNLKIDETRIPQDGRFDCITMGHTIDLRISTLPTIHGEKVAMRILDKSGHIYTLEELGLTGRGLKTLLSNLDKPYGVVLSTGPTGSGKTTTLYAILIRISNASVNIVTLEDPVEYEMPGLNQCQIKPKIGFSFANGLRSVLRQDPNIIMVGEIRDSETAALATHAALTGHLVLSTLHTNDASGALPRLIDMGVEAFFLTSLINAIIAQRLVRKLCPDCKHPAHIPEPIMKEIEAELAPFNLEKPYHFFEGRGCPNCELGYSGRVGIFEVLGMSLALENLILAHKQVSEIKAQAIRDGMVTMKQDGLMKALKGQTTVSEVLRVITI